MPTDMNFTDLNLWTSPEHALDYLKRADKIPHRTEGERTLLEFVPAGSARILDLGSGDGRLLGLILAGGAEVEAVALDFSPPMLDRLRRRFAANSRIQVIAHDLNNPLPDLGYFDAVVSSFAIHHLVHRRKRELYAEIFAHLNSGGVFCNLEHVASSTTELHHRFLSIMNLTPEAEDPSNKLLDLDIQLHWLREIGFKQVDCHWKWRELALLAGVRS
ncbi:MAG: class I SAM-dependent methyltransferase [Acidobacteria bacterium]|nr:class I SAM-dependent methyltransferase [Acidobacteriota bacterium]